jgi:hypothetical protein
LEAARELKAETAQDAIEVNKLDITLPGDMQGTGKTREAKGWKERKEKLGPGQKQKRPKGYRLTGDDP